MSGGDCNCEEQEVIFKVLQLSGTRILVTSKSHTHTSQKLSYIKLEEPFYGIYSRTNQIENVTLMSAHQNWLIFNVVGARIGEWECILLY